MQEVEFLPVREPLFVGSYAPIAVRVHKAGRLRFQDLDFLVPEGPSAGTISRCQEMDATAGVYQVLLLAGTRLGRHELHAVLKGTRKSIASMRFELTDRWCRPDRGPSIWLGGDQNSGVGEPYQADFPPMPAAASTEVRPGVMPARVAQPNQPASHAEHRAPAATAVLELDEEYEDIASALSHAMVRDSTQAALNQPAPSIRPWGAPPWRSPDISVTNARSAVDPSYSNLPWPGYENTITARITNRGAVSAPSVVADFYEQEYGAGAPEALLGSDTHEVPAGSSVAFSCPWEVPRGCAAHHGVTVRIRPYRTANGISEITQLNNTARSSYTQLIVGVSPSTREVVSFTLGNPYDVPVQVRMVASQDNPQYRTYLEHQWVKLGAREVRKIKVMFEFSSQPEKSGAPAQSGAARERVDQPNHVSLVALIDDPACPGRLVLLGGADATVLTGRATRITRFRVIKGRVHGIVITVSDRWPVPRGKVLITARRHHDGSEKGPACLSATLDALGRFVAEPPEDWCELEANFLYEPGFADCKSEVIKR